MFEVMESSDQVGKTIQNEYHQIGLEPDFDFDFSKLSHKVEELQTFLLQGNGEYNKKAQNLQFRLKELYKEFTDFDQNHKLMVETLVKKIEAEKKKIFFPFKSNLAKFRIVKLDKAEKEYQSKFQNFVTNI